MKALITASISEESLRELNKLMEITYEPWRETGIIYFDVRELVEKLKNYDMFINEVDYFFNNIFKEIKFSRKTYGRMYLSVIEAITNAIIHGNKKNPTKFVTVKFIEKSDSYIIKVDDEGEGFDFNIVPNPLSKSNIRKESGRGIFIIKQYADKVIFENKGASINLIFNK